MVAAAVLGRSEWRDHPHALRGEPLGKEQALVKAATGAVDHQQWRTGTGDGIFHGTAGRGDGRTATFQASNIMPPLALLTTLFGTLMLTACTRQIAVANHDSSMLIAAIRIANATPGAERITLAHRGLYVINDPAEAGLLLPALSGKLTIDGNGAEIRSYAPGPVALLEVSPGSDVTLRGLSLAEGSDGAVRNFGKLRLQSSRIVDSTGSHGSAIVLNRGQLEVEDSEVAYNNLQESKADGGNPGAAAGLWPRP